MTQRHAYLMNSLGELQPFVRVLAEDCPLCKKAQLGIINESPTTQHVLCTTCDYRLSRPFVPPANKRMNDGQ